LRSLIVFVCLIFCFNVESRTCDCLQKVNDLLLDAEEQLGHAYTTGNKNVELYHGKWDAMTTAFFQISQQLNDECNCISIVTKLRDRAEAEFDYVERYSYWAGDTWYWLGALNAYNKIIETLKDSG
jgi:hypothetical protein